MLVSMAIEITLNPPIGFGRNHRCAAALDDEGDQGITVEGVVGHYCLRTQATQQPWCLRHVMDLPAGDFPARQVA